MLSVGSTEANNIQLNTFLSIFFLSLNGPALFNKDWGEKVREKKQSSVDSVELVDSRIEVRCGNRYFLVWR